MSSVLAARPLLSWLPSAPSGGLAPLRLALVLGCLGGCSEGKDAEGSGPPSDGAEGSDGTDGSDGADGTDGSDGTDGEDVEGSAPPCTPGAAYFLAEGSAELGSDAGEEEPEWTDVTDVVTGAEGDAVRVVAEEAGTLKLCEGTFHAFLEVGADLRVVGEGRDQTVLSGGFVQSVVTIEGDGITAELEDLTLQEGMATHVLRSGHWGALPEYGGGVFCDGNSDVTLRRVGARELAHNPDGHPDGEAGGYAVALGLFLSSRGCDVTLEELELGVLHPCDEPDASCDYVGSLLETMTVIEGDLTIRNSLLGADIGDGDRHNRTHLTHAWGAAVVEETTFTGGFTGGGLSAINAFGQDPGRGYERHESGLASSIEVRGSVVDTSIYSKGVSVQLEDSELQQSLSVNNQGSLVAVRSAVAAIGVQDSSPVELESVDIATSLYLHRDVASLTMADVSMQGLTVDADEQLLEVDIDGLEFVDSESGRLDLERVRGRIANVSIAEDARYSSARPFRWWMTVADDRSLEIDSVELADGAQVQMYLWTERDAVLQVTGVSTGEDDDGLLEFGVYADSTYAENAASVELSGLEVLGGTFDGEVYYSRSTTLSLTDSVFRDVTSSDDHVLGALQLHGDANGSTSTTTLDGLEFHGIAGYWCALQVSAGPLVAQDLSFSDNNTDIAAFCLTSNNGEGSNLSFSNNTPEDIDSSSRCDWSGTESFVCE